MSRGGEANGELDGHNEGSLDAGIFDVVVAGAGPAGAIAARHLAGAGRGVLMLDRLRPTAVRLGEVLPGAARRLLARVGLDEAALGAPAHAPVTGAIVVWGDETPQTHDAVRDPYGPALRLDRARFGNALRQASLAAESRWSRTNVRDLEQCGAHWILHRDDGHPIRARVIIDATGRSARLLRLMGQPRQTGVPLVALYQVARPEKNAVMERTLIEALPEGWLYAGRLGEDRWAIGYHTGPEDAARLRRDTMGRAALLSRAPHLRACLGALDWEGPVLSRDARSLAAATPCGPGWFAVGDAALAFDPIAGQGLFNALRTGLATAEAILAASEADSSTYATEITRVASIYRERRQTLYQAQGRWADQPFWRAHRAST